MMKTCNCFTGKLFISAHKAFDPSCDKRRSALALRTNRVEKLGGFREYAHNNVGGCVYAATPSILRCVSARLVCQKTG